MVAPDAEPRIKPLVSPEAQQRRAGFEATFAASPLPPNEMLANLGLFMKRQDLARVLFMDEMYRHIVPVHGIIVEFGVRWGQNLALFENLRGIHEPLNHNRRIVGFDTWQGFPSVHEADGFADIVLPGAYGVTDDYPDYLAAVLDYHESENPTAHVQKSRLVQGDVIETLPAFLAAHPETIIALAYFDLDLYEPTKACLEAIRPYLTVGSVLGFDELNISDFPGETVALREVLGLDRFAIRRSPYSRVNSYCVVT